ncbi:MAG: hypothetical protein H6740_28490 [Alphaproteobacteria bacterium]|nr:hypothetical protein [Alphaproteobacteria bacterium]
MRSPLRVRTATTPEQREAIYRFRYGVFVEELGRSFGSPDPSRRQLRDAEDEDPCTLHLYIDGPEGVLAAARIRRWSPGALPLDTRRDYGLDARAEGLSLAEVERFMVASGARGGAACPTLAEAIIAASRERCDLLICACFPALVRLYQRFGMQPLATRPFPTDDGVELPMGLPFTERARRSGLLGKGPVDLDPQALRAAVASSPLLAGLPAEAKEALAAQGVLLELPAGTRLIAAGLAQADLFLLLEGAAWEGHDLRGPSEVLGGGAWAPGARGYRDTVTLARPCRLLHVRAGVLRRLGLGAG